MQFDFGLFLGMLTIASLFFYVWSMTMNSEVGWSVGLLLSWVNISAFIAVDSDAGMTANVMILIVALLIQAFSKLKNNQSVKG